MTDLDCTILVVAKAPVAGLAKTRLTPFFMPEEAADLAAASLLDTLTAVRSAEVGARIVALVGDLALASRGPEIASMLGDFTVLPQKGLGFANRLIEAHRDAAAITAAPVLQIGMDTPQVSSGLLTAAAAMLIERETDAVFGPANDGGWWALGISHPTMASVLEGIAMSRADTGAKTLAALQAMGCAVSELPMLSDVDTPEDVWLVAKSLGAHTHFRLAVAELGPAV